MGQILVSFTFKQTLEKLSSTQCIDFGKENLSLSNIVPVVLGDHFLHLKHFFHFVISFQDFALKMLFVQSPIVD
jgi:hypothetical protein